MSEFQIILYLVIGGIGLFAGAEILIRGSSSLAINFGISSLIVGLTVVAFATSSPELVVSVKAALEGNSGIAVGNVVGSNICNIALILGVAALITPIKVSTQLIRREIPLMILISFVLVVVLLNDYISRVEGILMFMGIIAYVILGYRYALEDKDKAEKIFEEGIPKKPYKISVSIILVIAGLALLVYGSNLFVEGAVGAAELLGASQAVIGLTIVAFGTSLPELITSIMAAIKKENDLAVGNAVGSNVFNILSILGITSIIHPIEKSGITPVDLSIMMFFAIIIFPLCRSKFVLRRWEGGLLFAGYIFYIIYLGISQNLF